MYCCSVYHQISELSNSSTYETCVIAMVAEVMASCLMYHNNFFLLSFV